MIIASQLRDLSELFLCFQRERAFPGNRERSFGIPVVAIVCPVAQRSSFNYSIILTTKIPDTRILATLARALMSRSPENVLARELVNFRYF